MAGIIGVDCSGSKTYLPLFVGACYSKERKDMEEVYKKIKALAAKENKIFGYTREIKAVDLKSESTMQQIMGEISKSEFNVLEVAGDDFHLLKKTFSGNFKWESKPSDAKLFEFLLARFGEKEKITTDFSTVSIMHKNRRFLARRKSARFSCDTETAVKLADIAAGVIRKNGAVRKIYKNHVMQLDIKEALRLMNDIRKI